MLGLDPGDDRVHTVLGRCPPLEDQLVPENPIAVQPDLRFNGDAAHRLDHHVGYYSRPNEGHPRDDQADESPDEGVLRCPRLLGIPRGSGVHKSGIGNHDRRDHADQDRHHRSDGSANAQQLLHCYPTPK